MSPFVGVAVGAFRLRGASGAISRIPQRSVGTYVPVMFDPIYTTAQNYWQTLEPVGYDIGLRSKRQSLSR